MWRYIRKATIIRGQTLKPITRLKITITKTTGSGKKTIKQEPKIVVDVSPQDSDPKITFPGARKALQLPNEEKEKKLARLQFEIRTHHEHGNYKDALSSSKDLLEEATKHFGKDHPVTASSYNNIGLMYKLMGDWQESRRNYHESLRIYGRVVGKDHASYAAALHNIGSLNKMQVHVDESMTAIQRLQLNEEALDYLQDAWRIRQVELGDDHPHTISSRSYYGAALASQVLQTAMRTKTQRSKKPSKLTEQRWNAAEDHLRQALKQAIENSRVENSNSNLQGRIKTLSAAAVAQNLAVFLKSRVTEIIDDDNINILDHDVLAEAKNLYEEVLEARSELMHEAHPDVVATKFSLAELMSILGDEKKANELREEIMTAYNVHEGDEKNVDDGTEKSDSR